MDPEGVDQVRLLRRGFVLPVQVGNSFEDLRLLRLGEHRPVGPLEVFEVIDGLVGRRVGGRLLKHHRLIEAVDRLDLLPGLDPREQPQRLAALAVGADAEPGIEGLGEGGVGVEDIQVREPGPERPLVEARLGDIGEVTEVEATVLGGHLHRDVGKFGRAPRHEIGAQHGEPATVVVDEGHRDRAPGRVVRAAEDLVLHLPGSGLTVGVGLAP
ncbi:hypothetical protein KIV56_17800 [Cryobacterium breve]|uniref:Uncharacterized protein n=1 Tax=Cryobacterium breve TaxID=1259258 RepID=A0ABY7NEI8_9MICO|nr:hypothetical protein [Cryobacterium breve]WBM79979.1 hypothetical protein KIV56_17800 [Cryobacterium breve]